jgi:hypothetical protein
MIRSTDIQPDTYKSGAYLRRWSISENGQAVCVEDAYPTSNPTKVEPVIETETYTETVIDDEGNESEVEQTREVDKTAEAQAASDAEYQATLDAQSERNAGIRQALADVEALEAARLVAEPEGDVPKTVTETDAEGNETERPFQAWAEYDAAQVTIAGATELTNNFETVRKGKPSETLPVMIEVERPQLDEEGNPTGVVDVVLEVDEEAEPEANPDYASWSAAWESVKVLND